MTENIIKERPPKEHKYGEEYGINVAGAAKRFDVSNMCIYHWIRDPIKRKWLIERLGRGTEGGILERPPRRRNTSKYRRLYSLTLRQIAEIFGVSKTAVRKWLRKPKKKAWLEKKLKEITEDEHSG